MEFQSNQKHFIGLTVVFGVVGVGLVVTAFATDNWVKAEPYRELNGTNARNDSNTGSSSFGLFNGDMSIDYGAGPRTYPLSVACDSSEKVCAYIFMRPDFVASTKLQELINTYKKHNDTSSQNGTHSKALDQIYYGLFSFPLWLCTIVFMGLSILLGLASIGFALFNVFGRPIETITGPMGLYLWNILAFLFAVVALALFGALYATQLSKNFLMYTDYSIGWRSDGSADLDFSYILVGGAGAAFLINIILLCLSGQSLNCFSGSSEQKEVDNGMILY